jgi:hypothetical protein
MQSFQCSDLFELGHKLIKSHVKVELRKELEYR